MIKGQFIVMEKSKKRISISEISTEKSTLFLFYYENSTQKLRKKRIAKLIWDIFRYLLLFICTNKINIWKKDIYISTTKKWKDNYLNWTWTTNSISICFWNILFNYLLIHLWDLFGCDTPRLIYCVFIMISWKSIVTKNQSRKMKYLGVILIIEIFTHQKDFQHAFTQTFGAILGKLNVYFNYFSDY